MKEELNLFTTILKTNLNGIIIIIGFILIHYYSKYFTMGNISVRSMSSFAAGVGIAYVIIHSLPQIAHSQDVLMEKFEWSSGAHFDYAIYVLVLLGFMIAYIMFSLDEKTIENMKGRDPDSLKSLYFWSDISFFAIYNALIGYLSVYNIFSDTTQVGIYFLAFGLHFLMIDWGLRHHHKELYDDLGRIILALSILIGGLLSIIIRLPHYIVVSFEAFISGAMILSIIKYELPTENQGSIIGFVTGAVSSGILFLFL
jgi:hypothetical protein